MSQQIRLKHQHQQLCINCTNKLPSQTICLHETPCPFSGSLSFLHKDHTEEYSYRIKPSST